MEEEKKLELRPTSLLRGEDESIEFQAFAHGRSREEESILSLAACNDAAGMPLLCVIEHQDKDKAKLKFVVV